MEKLVSKLQHTSGHLTKQRDLFVTRTKRAGAAMIDETRDAGRDLVESVSVEAKSWQRYVALRLSRLGTGVRSVVTPRAFEQRVLTGVGDALRALDARVRSRLVALEKTPSKRAKRVANGVAKPRAAKPARVTATKAAGASAIAGAARH